MFRDLNVFLHSTNSFLLQIPQHWIIMNLHRLLIWRKLLRPRHKLQDFYLLGYPRIRVSKPNRFQVISPFSVAVTQNRIHKKEVEEEWGKVVAVYDIEIGFDTTYFNIYIKVKIWNKLTHQNFILELQILCSIICENND